MHREPNEAEGEVVRRQRLTPEQRVPQILDAALGEFSRCGYAATRMDDIAGRAGLSKGGLYAHFESKDAILKALLDRSLAVPDWSAMPRPDAEAGIREVAQWIVDRLYETLVSPDRVAVLRILIAERERVPLRVDEWRESVTTMRTQQIAALIDECLRASGRQDSVLARSPWLALSPVMHVLMWQTVFGSETSPDGDFRQAHIDLLCELLA